MAFHYSMGEVSPDGTELVVSALGGQGDDINVGSVSATLAVNGVTVTPSSITKISQNRVKFTGFSGSTVIYKGDAVTLTVASGITDDNGTNQPVTAFSVVNLSRATPAASVTGATVPSIRTPEDAAAAIAVINNRLAAGDRATAFVPIADLAAGADIAALPVFTHPAAVTILGVGLLLQGASAAVDNADTAVVTLKNGSNTVATFTFNTAAQPTANVYNPLTLDATKAAVAAAGVLKLDVTQGTTADLPACLLVIYYRLT